MYRLPFRFDVDGAEIGLPRVTVVARWGLAVSMKIRTGVEEVEMLRGGGALPE